MVEGNRQDEAGFAVSPVPEAMGRLLALLGERVGAATMDRLWIFPPLVRGRKEWGLVVVSCMMEDPAFRSLVTGRYGAELTGQGVEFDAELVNEGTAPPARLPGVMDGVVRRSELSLGMPRELEIRGNPERLRMLLEEYGWDQKAPDRIVQDKGSGGGERMRDD